MTLTVLVPFGMKDAVVWLRVTLELLVSSVVNVAVRFSEIPEVGTGTRMLSVVSGPSLANPCGGSSANPSIWTTPDCANWLEHPTSLYAVNWYWTLVVRPVAVVSVPVTSPEQSPAVFVSTRVAFQYQLPEWPVMVSFTVVIVMSLVVSVTLCAKAGGREAPSTRARARAA